MVEKPISSRLRSPVMPSRQNTPCVFKSRPRVFAMCSPIESAVPDGASTLWRWWASMISISQ